jgi:hypothetical protein
MVQAPRDITRAHSKSTSTASVPAVGYLLLDAALMLALTGPLSGLAIVAFVPW